jgi:RNA polymerase sigma factor (sigma-70 family)
VDIIDPELEIKMTANYLEIKDPDMELVRLAKENDKNACDILAFKYRQRVFRQARRILTPDLADDATTDTFFRVKAALPGFQGRSKFSSWLFKIARRVCIAILRRNETNWDRDGNFYKIYPPHNPLPPDKTFLLRDQIIFYIKDMDHPINFVGKMSGDTIEEISVNAEQSVATTKHQMHDDRCLAAQKKLAEEEDNK